MKNDSKGTLRIGELSRRVGVSPALLRAWEKRYGLLQPSRSEGNFRLYSEADEQRVRVMQGEMARGLSAAEAARVAVSGRGGEPGPAEESDFAERERRALAEAALNFDEGGVQDCLDRAFALQSLEGVLSEIVLPCLREIGDGWERSEVSVAQEHFASNIIRSRLMALTRGWDTGPSRRVVLACVPGELHDLGLICFGLTLWRRGWRILYLGQATPVADMGAGVREANATALVVHVQSSELWAGAQAEIAELAGETRLAIGGAGVDAAAAERVGAELLEGDPVKAAMAAHARWS